MALFQPPDPQLVKTGLNQDQLWSHRVLALYPGKHPIQMYNSACYYLMHVLGIDIAGFHRKWILDFCFMGAKNRDDWEYLKILYEEVIEKILLTPEMSDKELIIHDGVLADNEVKVSDGRLGQVTISYRGSIKSTIYQGLATWEAQRGKIDIAIGTYSLGQITKEWIPNFRIMLVLSKENLQLEWFFEKDNEAIKTLCYEKDSQGDPKVFSRLSGVGHRGAIRMIHPDLWIIDDWLDKKMESTLDEAERVFKQEIFGTRVTGGRICVVGTILAEGDMLYKIRFGEIGAKFFNFSGFYPCYKDKALMIPRWWKRGKDFLDEQLDVQGEIIFQIEYMLNPMSDKTSLFKSKFIEAAKKAGMDLCLQRIKDPEAYSVTGNDFQFSTSQDADWGVNMGLEIFEDEKPRIRILGMDRYQGRDEDEILEAIEDDYRRRDHDLVGFESNGFQRILANMWLKRNIALPYYTHDTLRGDYTKPKGIPSLGQIFTDLDVAIPWDCEDCREEMGIFVRELQGWQYNAERKVYVSKSRYKDTTLAFWIAILTVRMAEAGGGTISEIEL